MEIRWHTMRRTPRHWTVICRRKNRTVAMERGKVDHRGDVHLHVHLRHHRDAETITVTRNIARRWATMVHNQKWWSQRSNPHPTIPESKCNWNKKSKSWRPEWVCHKMKVEYVARSKFSSSNGRYPSSSDKDEWWCVDLDEESTDDDDWKLVKRKNNRNATYYVHINKMYAWLPKFLAPLNPHVENTIPVHHHIQFRIQAEQRRTKTWKKQLASLYKTDAPQALFNQSIKELKSNIPRVWFHCTPKIVTFNTSNDATMMTYDSGADGHYFIENYCKKSGLPIIRRSTKRAGVANGGTSTGKYFTKIHV